MMNVRKYHAKPLGASRKRVDYRSLHVRAAVCIREKFSFVLSLNVKGIGLQFNQQFFMDDYEH